MNNSSRISLVALGAAFISVAALIIRKQRKAATCDLHSRTAGNVASALALFTGIIGLALIAIAMFV